MKVKDIDINFLKNYLRVDNDEDDFLLLSLIEASRTYIKSITGQDDTYIDSKDDITIALLSLCAEMYENREYTVKSANVNKIVKTILNMNKIDNMG